MEAGIKMKVELTEARATPNEGQTLEELKVYVESIGNTVIETNEKENYLLLKIN